MAYKEYDTSIYFEVFDEVGFVGAISREKSDLLAWHSGITFLDALSWIKVTLNNANLNLFSKKDKVPREIFALRLLERLPIEGDDDWLTSVPMRTLTTSFKLEPFEKDYNIENIIDERYTLTLDFDEAQEMSKNCELRVYINLDTKSVMLENFMHPVDEGTYCKIKLYNPLKIKDFKETLEVMPPYLTEFNFNILEDIAQLIEKNGCGFRSVVGVSIYLPK